MSHDSHMTLKEQTYYAISKIDHDFRQGGLKNGQRTLKIFWDDWYAREISRFVCNKVRCFKLDGSGNCIIRKTWLHCI